MFVVIDVVIVAAADAEDAFSAAVVVTAAADATAVFWMYVVWKNVYPTKYKLWFLVTEQTMINFIYCLFYQSTLMIND